MPAKMDDVAPRRAVVHTLGCRLNQTESVLIEERLEALGYAVGPDIADADLVVVHTCCVTREAQAKSRQQLRRLRRLHPRARVVALGCYADLRPEELGEASGADLAVGNASKLDVEAWLTGAGPLPPDRACAVRDDMFTVPFSPTDAPIARRMHLKIQEGCDNRCSYCVVWRARGAGRSRSFDDLLDEAEHLRARGALELVLTGVNVGTYRDGARGIVQVVDGLAALGIARVRLSSIELGTIPEELLDRMAMKEHPLLPYLHIPLQSGSDRILGAMRRRYCREDYLRYLDFAARRVENIGLGCDIMTGFPGETEEDFEASCRVLEASALSYAHVFKYSEHRDTPSAQLPGKVPPKIMQERSRRLMALSEVKYAAFLQRQCGRALEVLFEQLEGDYWTGYAGNYARVGVCYEGVLRNVIGTTMVQAAESTLARGALIHDGLELDGQR